MPNVAVKPKRKLLPIWLLAGAALSVFLAANAHLVYVAVRSEPDCVPHLKEKASRPDQFRAASPSC
jgi:hypothetical protein